MKDVKSDESAEASTGSMKLLRGISGGISQMALMFKPPHLKNATIAYTIQFCILFG
jgi:hypothetical protein